MKRTRPLFCLLLALILLTGCGAKEDASPLQPLLNQLSGITEQTRSMTDEELAVMIQSMAAEHHLTLNDEQLTFLISACRTLETADNVGQTVNELSKQLSKVGKAVSSIADSVGKVSDAVTDLLD